jgi:hypothetical protein
MNTKFSSSHSVAANKTTKKEQSFRTSSNATTLRILKYPGVLFPDRYECKMEYQCKAQLSGITDVFHIYRANSVYDPDYTNIGSTAYGLALLGALWGKNLVKKCSMQIRFISLNSIPCIVGWSANDTGTGPATVQQCASQRYGAVSVLTPISASGEKFMSADLDISSLMGQRNIDSDPSMYCANNANPTDVAWIYVGATPVDGSSTTNVYAVINFEFSVAFKEALF